MSHGQTFSAERLMSGFREDVLQALGYLAPHRVEYHRKLARYGDPRLLEPAALREPEAPRLQPREAHSSRQQRRRRLIQVRSRQLIAVFRDATVPADLAGLVAARREPEVGSRTG